MRRLLLVLLFAFVGPFVLAKAGPWLAAMLISPQPVVLHHPDGTTQVQIIGPQAPWPEWVPVPDGAGLAVRAWLGPSPGRSSGGFAELSFGREARAIAAAYARRLAADGWKAKVFHYRNGVPGPVVPHIIACMVQATRTDDGEFIEAIFEVAPRTKQGRRHWVAPKPPGRGEPISDEPC